MRTGNRSVMGLGILALFAAGFTSLGSLPTKVAADTAPITFGTPTVMDPVHTYGEPNVGINPVDGSMYDSGPEGTGVQRSGWEGSVDGGQTFRIVGQCASGGTFTAEAQGCATPNGPSNVIGDQPTGTAAPGGGDAEQKFDSKGNQYFADLYALACQRVAYTANDGATAPESALGCGQTKTTCPSGTVLPAPFPCPGEGSDRQWLSVLDPGLIGRTSIPNPAKAPDNTSYTGQFPLVYMEYNNLNTIQTNCSTWLMSGNPGNGNQPGNSGGTVGLTYQAANDSTNGNFGCDGYPSIDQYTGQVLEASTCSTNSICLNIGTPDSTGFLHFLDDSGGPGLITVANGLSSSGALLFVVSSIDSGQNLHVAFGTQPNDASAAPTNSADWQIYTTVASATSGWTQWAPPVKVSQSPSDINIFPWIQAGNCVQAQCVNPAQGVAPAGAGRSDTVWYGNSDPAEGPSSTSPGNQVWNVYMGQVVWPTDPATGAYTGGTTGAPVSNTMVQVTPHPMQYGGICLLGTGCITAEGNRNIADFFEVNIDKDGAAVISYDDTADNIIQNGYPTAAEAADHHGAAVITFGRQTAGPGLLGYDVPTNPQYQPATPVSGMNKTTSDALYPVINDPTNPSTPLPALNFTGTPANHLSLSGDNSTLTVTMNLSSLTNANIQNVFTTIPGTTDITYVTRWLMVPPGVQKSACEPGAVPTPQTASCSMYYAMAEVTPAVLAGGQPTVQFAAGLAQSIDLCSVSACFPHVIYYSEGTTGTDGGHALSSGATFDQTGNAITIGVPTADVGNPNQSTLLEEVGSYALVSNHPQEAVTNAQAQTDDVPFEVDGVCCFNFQSTTASTNVAETPWTPALAILGATLLATGIVLRRRRRGEPLA